LSHAGPGTREPTLAGSTQGPAAILAPASPSIAKSYSFAVNAVLTLRRAVPARCLPPAGRAASLDGAMLLA